MLQNMFKVSLALTFCALKNAWKGSVVLGGMVPDSADTEKSSPRFSKPVNFQLMGNKVLFVIIIVFVSCVEEKRG